MKRFQAVFCAMVAVVGTVSAQTTRPGLQPSAGVVGAVAPVAAAEHQTSALASARQTGRDNPEGP